MMTWLYSTQTHACILMLLYAYMLQAGLTALHLCIPFDQLNILRILVQEFNVDPDVVEKVSDIYIYTVCVCMC